MQTAFYVSNGLSCYDCAVLDAIYTLYKSGYKRFSTSQVLKTLSGDMTQTLTDLKREEIETSIERLRSTQIAIDCTEEMRKRELWSKQDGKFQLEGNFLSLIDSGRKYELSSINDLPLYRYAELNRQIIAAAPELLSVYTIKDGKRKRLTNTRENILIKRYLIQRIEIMRNPRNSARGRKISYYWEDVVRNKPSGMLFDLQIPLEQYASEEARRHKFLQIHNTVVQILDYYQNIVGYIEGYEVLKGPRGTIKGVQMKGKIRESYLFFQEDLFNESSLTFE